MYEKKLSKFLVWPFIFFLLLPISGISFLTSEILYLSIEEWVLIFILLWFYIFNKEHLTHKKIVILFSFLLYCGFYTVPLLASDTTVFEFLKEVKPYFFILAVILFITLSNKSYLIAPKNLIYILSFAIVVDVLVWFSLINIPELMPEGIRKEFFYRNNIYRYFDSATLLLQTLTILAFYYYRGQMFKVFFVFVLYVILVYLTQDRVYLLFGMMAFFFYSNRQIKILIFAFISFSVFMLVDILNSIESNEAILRFQNLMDFELILSELATRFILPVVNGGYDFSATSILLGSGIDFKFYIPWYEYRGLEVYHNSVDSFFITFFVKHGIIGVVLFLYAVHVGLKGYPKLIYTWVFVYLVMHNGFYVMAFLLTIVFMSFLYAKPSSQE